MQCSSVYVLIDLFAVIIWSSEQAMLHVTRQFHLQDNLLCKYYASDLLSRNTVDTSNVNERFVRDLRALLVSRKEFVYSIKAKAFEAILSTYEFDSNIQPYDYHNGRYQPPNPVELETRFSTEVLVNVNRSYVQCSTEIYQYHKEILNFATASVPLDDVYRQNYANEPSLLWQSFCSIHGAMRIFPGRNSNRKIDLYDCRRRLWYNQAINSPKDVVLALDMSGSMTGSHFVIAKLIVQSLIDTLQQDDFFNVLYFNENTDYLIPCLNDSLSQATSYYKNEFKSAVKALRSPTGISDFPKALQASFQLLEKTSERVTSSSNCTKIIMLISDGIDYEERTQEILDRYNGDKKVVIFSYIIGSASKADEAEMKDIACANGGEHYKFPSVGNVLDDVLKYQKRLSKPLGKSKQDHVIFTPLYLDGSGLGMMTTISTAVFSTRNDSGAGELIGVAGMDIVVSLLQQQYPIQKMGVFGHAFAINNNGLFLMHPKFKDQSGYLPDPATVYLDEVEFTIDPQKAIDLKKAMINGAIGCMEAEADWLFPKNSNKRVVRLNNTYCYRPMNNTPFFAGVSMPVQNRVQMIAKKEKKELYFLSGVKALNQHDPNLSVEVASWSFCDITTEGEKKQPASIKYYPTANDLFQYLDNTNDTLDRCNEEMLLTLLLSASIITNFTRDNWSLDKLRANDILDSYIITASGFMTMLSTNFTRSKKLERDIFEEIRYSHPASFYKAPYRDDLTFSVSLKSGKPPPQRFVKGSKIESKETVAIGKSIYSNDTLLAVVGMTATSSYMESLLLNAASNSSLNCSASSVESCYIIDENGYVVTSNRGNYQVGYFVGYFQGKLVEEMLRAGLFEKRDYIDTQAECPQVTILTSDSSPGNILRNCYQNLLHFSYSVTTQTFSILWWILTSLLTVNVDPVESADAKAKNVSCTKNIEIYLLKNNSLSASRVYGCSLQCNQSFKIQSLSGTNLAMIAVEDHCKNSSLEQCPVFSKDNEPKRVNDLDICNRPIRYRRALSVCYRLTGERSCAYVNEHKESTFIIYLIVFISVCFAIIIALVFNIYFRKYFHGRCL